MAALQQLIALYLQVHSSPSAQRFLHTARVHPADHASHKLRHLHAQPPQTHLLLVCAPVCGGSRRLRGGRLGLAS